MCAKFKQSQFHIAVCKRYGAHREQSYKMYSIGSQTSSIPLCLMINLVVLRWCNESKQSFFFWRITALDRIFLWKTHNSLRPLAPNSTAISMVFAIHKSFKTFQITETHLFSQWLKEKRLLLKRGTRTQRKAISWLLSWWGFISSCRKVSHSAASHAFLFLLVFFCMNCDICLTRLHDLSLSPRSVFITLWLEYFD